MGFWDKCCRVHVLCFTSVLLLTFALYAKLGAWKILQKPTLSVAQSKQLAHLTKNKILFRNILEERLRAHPEDKLSKALLQTLKQQSIDRDR